MAPLSSSMTTVECSVPAVVTVLLNGWDRYCAALEVFNCELAQVRDAERAAKGVGPEEPDYMLTLDDDAGIDFKKVRVRVLRAIIAEAAQHFAAAGAKLEISYERLHEICPRLSVNNCTPRMLWDALQEALGGGRGERASHEALAKRLRGHFDMDGDSPMKIVGGRVVLEVRYMSPMRFDCDSDLMKLGADLAAVQMHDGADLGFELDFFNRQAASNANDVRRGKEFVRAIPYGGLWSFIFYKSKIEVKMAMEYAEKLNQFMADFPSSDSH